MDEFYCHSDDSVLDTPCRKQNATKFRKCFISTLCTCSVYLIFLRIQWKLNCSNISRWILFWHCFHKWKVHNLLVYNIPSLPFNLLYSNFEVIPGGLNLSNTLVPSHVRWFTTVKNDYLWSLKYVLIWLLDNHKWSSLVEVTLVPLSQFFHSFPLNFVKGCTAVNKCWEDVLLCVMVSGFILDRLHCHLHRIISSRYYWFKISFFHFQ